MVDSLKESNNKESDTDTIALSTCRECLLGFPPFAIETTSADSIILNAGVTSIRDRKFAIHFKTKGSPYLKLCTLSKGLERFPPTYSYRAAGVTTRHSYESYEFYKNTEFRFYSKTRSLIGLCGYGSRETLPRLVGLKISSQC